MTTKEHLLLFALSFLSMFFISCNDEEPTPEQLAVVYPSSYVIAPDTVGVDTDSALVIFNYTLANGCEEYKGVDITETETNVFIIKLKVDKHENNSTQCTQSIEEYTDSFFINLEGRTEATLNFLDENDSIKIARKIVKSSFSQDLFTLKFESVTQNHDFIFLDTISVILHNKSTISQSAYRDTIFTGTKTNFIVKTEKVPVEYNKIYFTIRKYLVNCDKGFMQCTEVVDAFSGKYTIEKGVPTVIKVHGSLQY